jgi:hypothetical protein
MSLSSHFPYLPMALSNSVKATPGVASASLNALRRPLSCGVALVDLSRSLEVFSCVQPLFLLCVGPGRQFRYQQLRIPGSRLACTNPCLFKIISVIDRLPTYEEIKPGTPKTPLFTGVSPVFSTTKNRKISYGDLTENRTPIARMKTWCPNR